MRAHACRCMSILLVVLGCAACDRAQTTEPSAMSPEIVEQTVRQTVDGIKGPMDKARSVEGTLEQAAQRTAEQTSQGLEKISQ